MSIIRSKLLDGIHAKSTPFTPTPEIPASSVQAAMQYLIEHMLIGTTVQAWDANLDQIAALTPTDGNVIVGDGSAWVAESGNTARTSLGLGTGDSPTFTAVTVGNTGLTVGSSSPFSDSSGTLTLQNIDALDATTESTIEASIDTLANLTSIQGVGFTFGAYAPTLLNTANEAGFKAAVNLEIGVDVQAYDADLTTWAGLTPSANAQSLVTAANYASMRALLDLEAGTDFYSIPATDSAISTAIGALSSVYQPLDSDLTSLAGLGSAADKVAYTTGAHAWAETALTSFGRSLIDDADAATARSTLGLVIGTNVQAYDAELAALAGLTSAADSLPYFTGSGTASLATFTSAARNLLDDSDATTMRTTLGLAIGTDVQAYDADLASISALATTAAGRSVLTVSDDNLDEIVAWDDSAGTMKTMGLADLTTEASPATGDYVLIYGAEGDLRKADWSTLPGGGSSANTALSNLASVAINTTLVSDTDNTDDLGTSSIWWRTGYFKTGIEIGATDTTLTRSAAGILAVEGVVMKNTGKETIWVPATAMTARTTNGAASGTAEMTTNKNMFKTLDFDTSTQEFAQFEIHMPKSWNLSTITFQPVWSHASTATNFGVVWALQAIARSDDDVGDVAFGTEQTSTDTGGTTNDIYIGPESSAITVGGTPASGDTVQFQIKRNPSDGSDTLAIDARLHGIRVFFTTNAATDA